MDAPQCGCTTCTGIGVTIFDDYIDEVIDLGIRECITRAVAETTERLEPDNSDKGVGICYEILTLVSDDKMMLVLSIHSPAKVPG